MDNHNCVFLQEGVNVASKDRKPTQQGYVHQKSRFLRTVQDDGVILTLQVPEGFPSVVESDGVGQVVFREKTDLVRQRDFFTTSHTQQTAT